MLGVIGPHMFLKIDFTGGFVFAVSARNYLFLLTTGSVVKFLGKNLKFSYTIRVILGLVLVFMLSQVPGHEPFLSGSVITCRVALKLPFL